MARRGRSFQPRARGRLAVAIPLAFVHQAISGAIYVLVALLWLVPDRRIESLFRE